MPSTTIINDIIFSSLPSIDSIVTISIDPNDCRLKIRDVTNTIQIGQVINPQNLSIVNNSQHTVKALENRGYYKMVAESVL